MRSRRTLLLALTGTIVAMNYMPGKFVNAELDKASDENERQHLLIMRGDGVVVGMTQIAGLEAGELDAVAQLSPDLVAPYLDHDGIKVVFQTAGNPTHQIMPNTYNPELPDGSPNPFLDLRVRQAANMAINREAIIDNVLTGTEKPSFGPGPPAIGYAIPQEIKDEIYFGYNPEQAKQLLADAGYPDGFDITLHIVTDYQPIVGTLALIVKQDLEAVGIRTTIKEYLSAKLAGFEHEVFPDKSGAAALGHAFANAVACRHGGRIDCTA